MKKLLSEFKYTVAVKTKISLSYLIKSFLPVAGYFNILINNAYILNENQKKQIIIFLIINYLLFLILYFFIQNRVNKPDLLFILGFLLTTYQSFDEFITIYFKFNNYFSKGIIWFLLSSIIIYFLSKINKKKLSLFVLIYTISLIAISFFSLVILSFEPEQSNETKLYEESLTFNSKPDIYIIIYDNLASLDNLKIDPWNLDTYKFLENIENNQLKNYHSFSHYGKTNLEMLSLLNSEYPIVDEIYTRKKEKALNLNYQNGNFDFYNHFLNNGYDINLYGIPCSDRLLSDEMIFCYDKKAFSENHVIDLLKITPLKIFTELPEENFIRKFLTSQLYNSSEEEKFRPVKLSNLLVKNEKPSLYIIKQFYTHRPYVYDENCNFEYTAIDRDESDLAYKKEYLSAVNCALIDSSELIKNIDINRDIIFMVSDHGPWTSLFFDQDIENTPKLDIKNRYETFFITNIENVCRLDEFKPGNVNIFRNIFNCISNKQFSLLEVEVYFTKYFLSAFGDKVIKITTAFK